jgi:ABC-2 type transport system permease protein
VTAPSVSFARALGDLRAGWEQRELWLHLGWQDIRRRYRRSVPGPIWISITMVVTAVALGVLYAGLFNNDVSKQLPNILVGLIISGCILEGSEVFSPTSG